MNHFIGIGRISDPAELKYTASGSACTKFTLCINKAWKDRDGKRQEKPHFFNCVIWGKYGETMVKYLTRGKQICMDAELEQNIWTDSNGNNHSSVQLVVNEINLLASPRNEGGGGNAAGFHDYNPEPDSRDADHKEKEA
ncbi:MAG: single-stranded DNA-binding protein [Spirochaetaceae bacterium]|jgi:single-strand DNA-binding protein|nr:single-stranded DNA-binding protein [Spirochaetaceae bacterium]